MGIRNIKYIRISNRVHTCKCVDKLYNSNVYYIIYLY